MEVVCCMLIPKEPQKALYSYYCPSNITDHKTMGRRKYRLSHRKNTECKRQWKKQLPLLVSIPQELVTLSSFKLSLPVSVYTEGNVHSLESLSSRLRSLSLPESWMIASMNPLTLCKLRVHQESSQATADVSLSVSINNQLHWLL